MRYATWRATTLSLILGIVFSLAACGGGPDDGRFLSGDESSYPLKCMEHQSEKPGRAYTAGENADTAIVLTMLRYYTANRSVSSYCDGKAPNGIDRAWAQLYVNLGADPANVARVLGQA